VIISIGIAILRPTVRLVIDLPRRYRVVSEIMETVRLMTGAVVVFMLALAVHVVIGAEDYYYDIENGKLYGVTWHGMRLDIGLCVKLIEHV